MKKRLFLFSMLMLLIIPGFALEYSKDVDFPGWDIYERVDPFTDETDLLCSTLPNTYNSDNMVFCINVVKNSLCIAIVGDSILNSEYVLIRLDKDPCYKDYWGYISNERGLYCQYPMKFLESLMEHNTLLIQYTTYSNTSYIELDITPVVDIVSKYPVYFSRIGASND